MTVLFFISVFTSLTWLVYTILYIVGQLGGSDLNALPASSVAMYAALVVLPVWVVWQVFGFVNQYFRTKTTDLRLTQLFNQMKKNQDYTDLVVRVMLDAEHEIKDGFVINKFDIFIADMNEILADIVQRCNAASSLQLEQLWARVKNGERWTIGKTLVEAAKNHENFADYVAEKARKDSVFKGTLREFCARYQNLNALLEKHDRDRVFINIIETGVMGKAYSILAPAAEDLNGGEAEEITETLADEKNYEVSPRILNMEAPETSEEKSSIWRKLNPFKRRQRVMPVRQRGMSGDEDDEFFAALQKSMDTPQQTRQNYRIDEADEDCHLNIGAADEEDLGPRFSVRPESTEPVLDDSNQVYTRQMNDTSESGYNLQEKEIVDAERQNKVSTADDFSNKVLKEEAYLSEIDLVNGDLNRIEPAEETGIVFDRHPQDESSTAQKTGEGRQPPRDSKVEENFAYPFGGWINEENYKK